MQVLPEHDADVNVQGSAYEAFWRATMVRASRRDRRTIVKTPLHKPEGGGGSATTVKRRDEHRA